MTDADPIESLKNLGPKSSQSLREIGIFTIGDLRRVGSVEAFVMLKMHGKNFNTVMLWAMEMGLQGRHWQDITPAEKRSLTAGLL